MHLLAASREVWTDLPQPSGDGFPHLTGRRSTGTATIDAKKAQEVFRYAKRKKKAQEVFRYAKRKLSKAMGQLLIDASKAAPTRGFSAQRNFVFPDDCEGRLASLGHGGLDRGLRAGHRRGRPAGLPRPPGRATQSSASCPRISPPGFATVWTFA